MFNFTNFEAVQTGQEDAGRWFALLVKPRHDKAVSGALSTKGYETFLPLYKKRHRYATRLKESDLPLFPGYVFCRFDPQARLPILITPGVIQVLGAGRMPIPVDESEIASLQLAIRSNAAVKPVPYLQAGQRVRITEGSLTGVEGIVVNSKEPLRLVLSITLLQRSVLLEIDQESVSPEPGFEPATRRMAA